jgi:nickel-dependent lactate racemase
MTKHIKLPQLAWYDPKELDLRVPDTWQVEVCNFAGYNRPAMTDDQIKAALRNPIGSPPIRELAKGKKEVVIIFDDIVRVTRISKIAPLLIEELTEAGIPDNKIKFIAGLGSHGPMDRLGFVKKLGEAIVARFPVYNHNPFHNCTYVGTTSRGTKVLINDEVMQCDFKIAIGSITPHISTVFSGGGKIILPGVSSAETIMTNHRIPKNDDYDTNLRRLDMDEAEELVGLDVNIEAIFNLWGDTVGLFVGAPAPSHAAGVAEARTHYLTPRAKGKDIVIANTYAKVPESGIGVRTAVPSVSEKGGDIVLIGNAPQGQCVHYLLGVWGRKVQAPLGKVGFPLPPNVNHLIVYNEYPDAVSRQYLDPSDKVLMMSKWEDVLKALQSFHKGDATVGVYPNADIQYCGDAVGGQSSRGM